MAKRPAVINVPGLRKAMKAANVNAAQLSAITGVEPRKMRNWVAKQRVRVAALAALERALGKHLVADRSLVGPEVTGHIPETTAATPEDIEQARQDLLDVANNVPVDSPARHRLLTGALDRFLALSITDVARRAVYRETLLELNDGGRPGEDRRSSNGNGDGDAH